MTHETIKELPVLKSQTYRAGSKIPIVAPKPHKTLKVSSQRKPVIWPVILRYVVYDIPLDRLYRILEYSSGIFTEYMPTGRNVPSWLKRHI